MRGTDPDSKALESLMGDAGMARLGPSRVAPDSGAAELLRALGQQLLDKADAMESGEDAGDDPMAESGEYELDDDME